MVLNISRILSGKYTPHSMWYYKLNTVLEARGFNNIGVDIWLLISYKVIWVYYGYDFIFFDRDYKYIDSVLDWFEKYGDQYKW